MIAWMLVALLLWLLIVVSVEPWRGRGQWKRGWHALVLWPFAQAKAAFEFWMLWRIREPIARIPRKLVCRACGSKRKAWIEWRPDSTNPERSVLAARCERCQAVWPLPPIYAAETWLPKMSLPKQRDEAGNYPIQQ